MKLKPFQVDGTRVCALMRAAKVTIRDLAEKMRVTQKRVREVRAHGVIEGTGHVWDWLEGIAGETPLYADLHDRIERNSHLLVAYHDDLVMHDRKKLEAAQVGDEFVWLARRHGTQLLPKGGSGPLEITYWIGCDPVMMYLHLRITRRLAGIVFGEVREVTADEIRRLAADFTATKSAA